MSRFFGNPKLEIRDSSLPNAGRGIFCIEDIDIVNTPLCYYDGYIKPKGKIMTDEEQEYGICHEGLLVIGFKEAKDKHFGVAQLINDGEIPRILQYVQLLLEINSFQRVEFLFYRFMDYTSKTFSKQNVKCKLHPKKKAIIFYSTKKLRKDEECFFSYDIPYWTGYFMRYFSHCDSPLKNLSGSMYTLQCLFINLLTHMLYTMKEDPVPFLIIFKELGIDIVTSPEKVSEYFFHVISSKVNRGELNIKDFLVPDWEDFQKRYMDRSEKETNVAYAIQCEEKAKDIAHEVAKMFIS